MTRTERVLTGALVLILTAGVGVGLSWARDTADTEDEAPARPEIRSVAVTRTDLSDARELDGTLGFGAARTIRGSSEGMVTWLPKVGRTVKRGQALFRVNDRPAVIFYGDTPVYRRLDTVGSVGRDVRVVADNLRALGYDIGDQPATGSSVRQQGAPTAEPDPRSAGGPADGSLEPTTPAAPEASDASRGEAGGAGDSPRWVKVEAGDGVLTASLMAAIKRWQPTAGFDATGVLDVADVVVTTGPVRVRSRGSRTGDPASADLMTVTGTTRKVTVAVDPLDLGSIKRKQRVSVTLPDQSAVPGTVTAISTIVPTDEDDPDGGGAAQLKVSVSVKQKQIPRSLEATKVQVKFTAEDRPEVLAVPVGALLALREGGYAVRISGGTLVPVETGLFAMGLVEISGTGIAEGTKVDTTS